MKRIFLSSLIITSLIYGASATRISSADAMSVAEDFLTARGIQTQNLNHVALHTRSGVKTLSGVNNDPYHIFNIGEGDGFVIVAGDDRLPSVLGYSLQGSINPDSMPKGCAVWLDANAEALSYIQANTPSKTIAYPTFSVEPLLKSHWDQRHPYNILCPIDKQTGVRSATGCVATAAAQVMGYYQFPVLPTGKVEYEDRIQNETRTFDFSAMTPIDWDHISYTYTSESSPEECEAVASLMNAMAHGVKMQFSSDTSTAYNYNAGHALINFFGYSPDMHYYERALVSDEEWISIIASELQAGRPVLYEGKNPSMGHAFVCDGYDGMGYFHINWGWGGLSDGYYSLSALTPPNQSTGGSDSGYSLSQTILCNIAPKDTPGLLPQEKGLLNIDKLYFRDSSAFHNAGDNVQVSSPIADAQLFFYSFNKGMKPFSGEVCAASIDNDVITPVSIITVEDIESQNYAGIRFPLASTSLSEGTHRIGFYYRTSPAGEWHQILSSTPGAPSQCYVTLSGDQATMNAVDPYIMPEMVESLSNSRLCSNSTATLSFELANSGSTRLEAYAGIAIMDADCQYLAFHTVPVLCPSGDKVTVEIEASLNGIPVGPCLLMPFYSYSPSPSSVDIHPLAYHPFHAVVEGILLTPAGGPYFMIDPEKTMLELNATNLITLDWAATVIAEIATQDGIPVTSLPATELVLGPAATTPFAFDCSTLTITRGVYRVRFLIADEKPVLLAEFPLMVTADMTSVSTVNPNGIEISVSDCISVASPENLIAVTLYDISGSSLAHINRPGCHAAIHAATLPPGIYFIHIATESGKTVTKKLKL